MNDIILELSRNNDKSAKTNYTWTNTFTEPVLVPKGAEIGIQQAIIDTNKIDNGNIDIDEDTTITIKFGYYDYLFDQGTAGAKPDRFFNRGDHNPNFNFYGDYYIAYLWGPAPFVWDAAECKVYQNEVSIVIPANNYSPNELQKFITDEWSRLVLYNPNTHDLYGTEKPFLVSTSKNTDTYQGKNGNLIQFLKRGTKTPYNNALSYSYVYSDDLTLGDLNANKTHTDYFIGASQVALGYDIEKERFTFDWLHTPLYNTAGTTPVMSTGIINLLGAANTKELVGLYDKDNSRLQLVQYAAWIVKSLQDAITHATPMKLIYVATNGTTKTFNGFIATHVAKFGECETIVSSNNIPADCEAYTGTSCQLYIPVAGNIDDFWIQGLSKSGIFLTDINSSPNPDFWKSIGFDKSKMCCPINEDQSYDADQFKKCITTSFQGLASLVNSGSMKVSDNQPPAAGTVIYIDATDGKTNAIDAGNFASGIGSGYYLIELETNFSTEYRTDTKIKKHIIAVASKNYNQNGFITIYQQSGLPFINNGEPFLLNNMRVNILDSNGLPAENVGGQSSIFLRIVSPGK